MPLYVRLIRRTTAGRQRLEAAADVDHEVRHIFEKHGGSILDAWATLGRYDYVSLVEAPDELEMARIAAEVDQLGYYEAETLMAVPIKTYAAALGAAMREDPAPEP